MVTRQEAVDRGNRASIICSAEDPMQRVGGWHVASSLPPTCLSAPCPPPPPAPLPPPPCRADVHGYIASHPTVLRPPSTPASTVRYCSQSLQDCIPCTSIGSLWYMRPDLLGRQNSSKNSNSLEPCKSDIVSSSSSKAQQKLWCLRHSQSPYQSLMVSSKPTAVSADSDSKYDRSVMQSSLYLSVEKKAKRERLRRLLSLVHDTSRRSRVRRCILTQQKTLCLTAYIVQSGQVYCRFLQTSPYLVFFLHFA